jgi:tRNA A-37 threonylcarbamoyl transferase component Bud32
MQEMKDTGRATVRIGFDGRVHKTFRGHMARERFEHEVRVLKYLEARGCTFVPRLLESDPDNLKMVTSNCGGRVDQLNHERQVELFAELENYGVRHEDRELRNITYRIADGRFCIIDFEFATILDDGTGQPVSLKPSVAQ